MMTNLLFLCALTISQAVAAPYREKDGSFTNSKDDVVTALTTRFNSEGNIDVTKCNFFGQSDQKVVFWCPCEDNPATFYSDNVLYGSLNAAASSIVCRTAYRETGGSFNEQEDVVVPKLTTRINGDSNIDIAKCNYFARNTTNFVFWCPCENDPATLYSGNVSYSTLDSVNLPIVCYPAYREIDNSLTTHTKAEVVKRLKLRIGTNKNKVKATKCNFFVQADGNVVFWCPCEADSATFYSGKAAYDGLETSSKVVYKSFLPVNSTCEKKTVVLIQENLKIFIENSPALNIDFCKFDAEVKNNKCTLSFRCECKNTHKSFFSKAIYSDEKSIDILGKSAGVQKCQLDTVRLVLVIVITIVLLAIIAIVVAKFLKVF